MARAKAKSGAKNAAQRRSAARSGARTKAGVKAKARVAGMARPKHKFVVKRFRPEDFKSDGLRAYAHYRDLGVKDATHGMVVAHAIRFVMPCDPKVVSKEHYHAVDFQMIYVLKGSFTSQFEGQGVHTMRAGDCWLQPPGIKHKALDYSDDCELLEIVMPANFKTVELEK
jgi:mannose-6-phosphate isomerase-like protein (cupin superfamily)